MSKPLKMIIVLAFIGMTIAILTSLKGVELTFEYAAYLPGF